MKPRLHDTLRSRAVSWALMPRIITSQQCRRAGLLAVAAVCGAFVSACGGSGTGTTTAPSTSTATTSTSTSSSPSGSGVGSLTLSSAAASDGGTLPVKYVCAARSGLGADTNPPLDWGGAPTGTVSFALLMSTIAKDGSGTTTKYNWVLYDIPATARSIPEANTTIVSGNTGVTVVGTPGLTSDGPQFSYSPPCSPTGSGLRTYTFTLYALSARPTFIANHVAGAGGDGANLAAAIAPLTLAKASLTTSFVF